MIGTKIKRVETTQIITCFTLLTKIGLKYSASTA